MRALRIGTAALLSALALGMALPSFAQDGEISTSESLTPNMTVSDDGLITYAAESCDYGGQILSISAVDASTVQFQLCGPDGAFPQKVAFSSLGIQPLEHLIATGGGGDALVRNPVGTGPYQLENWNLGNEIVLAANESYWGDPAHEPTAIFRWLPEAAARLTELQAGTVDGIDNPGAGDFEVIAADPNLQLFERPGLNIFYVGMNNNIAPFDNLNVRLAIAHAIDKQRIVDNFYPPGSTVADQFMPPDIFGWTEGFEDTAYDPEAARQLLADSGLTLPLEVTINYRDVVRSYLPQPGVVAQDIQAQLAEVGINVTIEVMESTAFLDASDAGDLGFYLLGWGADYPDATNFMDVHFGRGSSAQFGTHFTELEDLLITAGQESDPAIRLELYAQANAFVRDNAIVVPVAHGGSGAAYSADIEGAHTSPLGNENLAVMSDPSDDNIIFLQNGEPGGLYCADETDGESLRVCEQITEPLLAYEVGGTAVVASLAETWAASEDGLTWTFNLRPDVSFHDGSSLDANDVVMSYAVQWDAANPLHVGRDGSFTYWTYLFAAFLNAPAA
ncbi:MAG: putative ABC transporter substrate binding protein [Chloroflexi bacterium OLB15]|nr:MAG: putative ABC transporter substrate binding protein [Chloroflexi bacterium OLB15]